MLLVTGQGIPLNHALSIVMHQYPISIFIFFIAFEIFLTPIHPSLDAKRHPGQSSLLLPMSCPASPESFGSVLPCIKDTIGVHSKRSPLDIASVLDSSGQQSSPQASGIPKCTLRIWLRKCGNRVSGAPAADRHPKWAANPTRAQVT